MEIFTADQLTAEPHVDGARWREFLRVADLSGGIYRLPAGAQDEQQPHSEDEVYVVLRGVGWIHVAGEESQISPGSIIFVPAHAIHYFHTITTELALLVFFGPAEGSLASRRLVSRREAYELDTARTRLDTDLIYRYLSQDSYWAAGIERGQVERALANSFCFGIYHPDGQVGFGRVITDFATFAYISDVFILPLHQNKGLGEWLIRSMLTHPELQGLRKWVLHTRDAHPLYRKLGFESKEQMPSYMEFRP